MKTSGKQSILTISMILSKSSKGGGSKGLFNVTIRTSPGEYYSSGEGRVKNTEGTWFLPRSSVSTRGVLEKY
eukprot:5529795-Amphidinium_carterae.1